MALLNIPRISEYTHISMHIGLHLKQVTHIICRNKFKRHTFRSNKSECCKILSGRRSALGMPYFCSFLRCTCIFVTTDHRFFFFFFTDACYLSTKRERFFVPLYCVLSHAVDKSTFPSRK